MGLRDRITNAARAVREGRRRVDPHAGRVWVELRGGRPADPGALTAAVERAPGVRWARWNGPLERLVVSHDGDAEAALAAVREAERLLGLADTPFRPDPPTHPGDHDRQNRTAIRSAVDVAAIGIGSALRATRVRPRALEVDFAALTAALENLPTARRWLDRALGGSRSDLVLGTASALATGIARGSTWQTVDLAYRALRVAELRATTDAWRAREPELAAAPEHHPPDARRDEPRPIDLPKGPIELYSEPAGMVSIGGFGFGVATTRQAERAAGSVYGTVPRPARVGREAYGAALGRRLGRMGWLVLEDRTLRRLDRIDRIALPEALVAARLGELVRVWPRGRRSADGLLVIAHRMFSPNAPDDVRIEGDLTLGPPAGQRLPDEAIAWRDERPGRALAVLTRGPTVLGVFGVLRIVAPEIRSMIAHARALDLSIAVIGADAGACAWCAPERLLDPDRIGDEVRELQRHGHGVALVVLGPCVDAGAADVALGLPRPGAPAWGAHVIAPARTSPTRDAEDVVLLIDAIDAAKRASRQAVAISTAEAAAGLVLSVRGRPAGSLRRVMNASGVATLAAIGNGLRVAAQVVPHPSVGGFRTAWHALEPAEALARLGSSPAGLTAETALRRAVAPERVPGRVEAFARATWREMASPFAPILAAGAGLSALAGSPLDAGLVAGTMLAGGVVSGWQQVAAAEAMRALAQAHPMPVRVRRDGALREVEPESLVPGDVIELDAGARVPADCRLLEQDRLEVDESALTGESVPVHKQVEPSFAGSPAERRSMLYADTTIAAGRAVAVVVAVGSDTEARRGLLALRDGPLGGVQARLARIADLTGPIALSAGLSVVGMGLLRNRPIQELVDGAVSLAVAAVPETLPLLATAAQLAAARRLSERGALVRNASAVEALGRVDVLCADKTGTLTEGVLRLQLVSDGSTEARVGALDERLAGVLRAALLASPDAPADGVPHPTDRALLQGGEAAGVTTSGWSRLSEIPFEPARGYHATLARRGAKRRVFVKGAPEVVIGRCAGATDAWLDAAAGLASRGLRVLAVAERDVDRDRVTQGMITELTFRGFVAIADPVRATARDAVGALRRAGVAVMMITGDHPSTARAIGDALELGGGVLTGPEIDRLSDAELDALLPAVQVVARATPQHKVRLVAALQRAGRVVAMTGDGANDAPAIRLADVGIALGSKATVAARGASDVWVTDERIDTLVDAVLEGRAMWASVRDAVSILVGGNIGELAFTLLGSLISGRAPIGARQLMLVNLLTDALPAMTIAVRPPAHTTPERLMGEGPERSLGAALDRDLAWRASATATATLLAWSVARPISSAERAGTIALVTLVGTQLGQTLWLGRRNRPVIAAALVSGATLLAIVQTPGVSRLAGSRVLGPVGLANAALFSGLGVAGAALVPSAWRRADERLAIEARLRALWGSDVGRAVRENRLLLRLTGEADRPV